MTKKSYGFPYKGSKNIIAKSIVDALPDGDRLVDLFCGGCAVTDYALKNTNKFSRFLVNDLNGRNPKTYIRALSGGFRNEERWISRQDFFKLKETDDYVRLCFSFGNSGRTYMYNPELEPYKRALHHIIFWENYAPMEDLCPQVVDIIKEYCKDKDRKGRRLASGRAIADHVKQKGSVEYWQSNPMFRAVKMKWSEDRRGMSSCQWNRGSPLERLQSLESLGEEALIDVSTDDYRNYVYHDRDVVYCDPPYANTDKYTVDFDNEAFWQWCRTRDFPVYVSEYRAPEDFISIWCKEKRRLFNNKGLSTNAVERLFLHKKWI